MSEWLKKLKKPKNLAKNGLQLPKAAGSALFIRFAARFNPRVAISHIKPVDLLDAPELALYRTLKRVAEHERAGVLVAANNKVIKRLLASRFTVVSALAMPSTAANSHGRGECSSRAARSGSGGILATANAP